MPNVITECEGPQCGVWVFQSNKGQAMWQGGAIADLAVDKFDGHDLIISRADPVGSVSSPYGVNGHFTARYLGKISGDHITGTVTFNGNESGVYPWHATVPANLCNPMETCPLNANQLVTLADNAMGEHLHSAAIPVLRILAEQGNSMAQAMLALSLHAVQQPHAKNSEAFQWATKSAATDNPYGEVILGKIYRDGFGVPVNAELAKYWMDKGNGQLQLQAKKAHAKDVAQANEILRIMGNFGQEQKDDQCRNYATSAAQEQNCGHTDAASDIIFGAPNAPKP